MKYSLKIASIWGIPIELHVTFILLMAAFFAISYFAQDFYSFVLILFLFVFVVLHELSHSFVARHYGIKVRKIVLYPIGGVSEIEEIPENPKIEWRMAISGPLVSIIIGLVLLGVYLVRATPTLSDLFTLAATGDLSLDLAKLNIFLGFFNLIPAFPMDGGRVFRALLAERLSFSDATKYAAYIGRFFGILMVFVGVLFNFWLIVVGIFVYIGATEEAEQTILTTTMARVRVKDVMVRETNAIAPEATLAEAMDIMFKARYHDILVEKDGALKGVVCWDDIMKIKPEMRNTFKVEQLPVRQVSVFPDESILEAYKILVREKLDLMPVVNREETSKVIGVLTSEGIASAYEKAKKLR
jgi:Zn-dependent protease/predicted transcriptional regulator